MFKIFCSDFPLVWRFQLVEVTNEIARSNYVGGADHDVVCWKLASDLVGGSYLGIRDSAHYKYDEAWLRDIFLCESEQQYQFSL
jgi:hypothetical protein